MHSRPSRDCPAWKHPRQAHGLQNEPQADQKSPQAGASVAAWLNPTPASHLAAADIFTLAHAHAHAHAGAGAETAKRDTR